MYGYESFKDTPRGKFINRLTDTDKKNTLE
jgi:hypothetical protein